MHCRDLWSGIHQPAHSLPSLMEFLFSHLLSNRGFMFVQTFEKKDMDVSLYDLDKPCARDPYTLKGDLNADRC